jgi:hypothetical protein
MLKKKTNELLWEFPEARVIRFPFSQWILIGNQPASIDSVKIHRDDACIIYGAGQIRLELQHNYNPAASSLIQDLSLEFLKDTPDFLLDLRLAPDFSGGLNWLTIPGLFYGDNNLAANRVVYPKGLDQDWCFRADAASCPGLHLPGAKFGYAAFLETDRVNLRCEAAFREGYDDIVGIGWIHGPEDAINIRFTYPAQETPFTYHRSNKLEAPLEPRFNGRVGNKISFRIHHFITGPGRQGYFKPVRIMAEINRPADLGHQQKRLGRTAQLFAQCLRESHFLPGIGFSHRQDLPEVHVGWCGGFASVEAGLTYGEIMNDSVLYAQAETMANFICASGISPSGYFYAEYRDQGWRPNVRWGYAQGLHVRHASEGCLFLGRILCREMAKGHSRPLWWKALQSNLEAVIRDLRDDGALPIEVDPETGAIIAWQGATPGAWSGALIMGSVLAKSMGALQEANQYRVAAERAADYYIRRYIQEERFYGGPYDAYGAPNMEDPYNLLNALVELYRYTRKSRFLNAACLCADHLLSWRYTYNVIFPTGSICRDQGVTTYGMAPASVRNRHIQNWDTVAAVSLAELSRWTGDPVYVRSALDNLIQSCQLVEQGDGKLGIPMGGQSEQWYATEFHWFGSFGDYGKGNLWKVSVVLPKSGFLTAVALLNLNDYDDEADDDSAFEAV